MLSVTLPARVLWDEAAAEFIDLPAQKLQLEHSLISLSKWESTWEKPFLGREVKTEQETFDYIRCMTLTRNVDPTIYAHIPNAILDEISKYIARPMSATQITDKKTSGRGEVITAEIIYYWMITLSVPADYAKWHLNSLLTLIRVCNIKNSPPTKMGRKEQLATQRALNDQRLAAGKTTG